jgi:hypothetical protein
MNKIVVLITPLFLSNLLLAQYTRNGGNSLNPVYFQKLNTITTTQNESKDLIGSPFIEEALQKGTLFLSGTNTQNFFMRYNVLEQRVEFSDNNDVTALKILPKEDHFIIPIDNKIYQYLSLENLITDYYEIIKTFNENTLPLVRHTKNIIKIEQKNSYTRNIQKARILSKVKIFFLHQDKAIERDNHKKRSIKAFPGSTQSQLKTYIKKNKSKLNDDYKGLIALINNYITL